MDKKKFAFSAGAGLIVGAVASAVTGQWWLVAVGLVLGAGLERAAKRRTR